MHSESTSLTQIMREYLYHQTDSNAIIPSEMHAFLRNDKYNSCSLLHVLKQEGVYNVLRN